MFPGVAGCANPWAASISVTPVSGLLSAMTRSMCQREKTRKKRHTRKRVSEYPVDIPSSSDPRHYGIAERIGRWRMVLPATWETQTHTHGLLGNEWCPRGPAGDRVRAVQCAVPTGVVDVTRDLRVEVHSELPCDVLGYCPDPVAGSGRIAFFFLSLKSSMTLTGSRQLWSGSSLVGSVKLECGIGRPGPNLTTHR